MLLALLQAADPSAPTRVRTAIEGFTDNLLDYALALAAVGALAMALIELIKKIFDSRTKFHARRWTAWMTKSGEGTIKIDRHIAYADLIRLCTGVTPGEAAASATALMEDKGKLPIDLARKADPAYAVFSLEPARMMGAIQDAGDLALASPDRYNDLFQLITAGADRSDLDTWNDKKADLKDRAEAFARLRRIFKGKLDAFQLYTEQKWANYNQFASNLVGAIIMFAALVSLNDTLHLSPIGFFTLSIFGGILSPVAKDLVAALRRVRDG